MPIGAVIGGGVLAAGGAVAAASIGANAQKKAAQTAATTTQDTSAQNIALFRENKAENIGIAAPFYNNGVQAGNALQELLLGPSGTPVAAPAPAPATAGYPAPAGALAGYQTNPGFKVGKAALFNGTSDYPYYQGGGVSYGADGPKYQLDTPYGVDPASGTSSAAYNTGGGAYYGAPVMQSAAAPQGTVNATGVPATSTGGGALDAFARFRQGANYQWRFNEGMRSTQGQYATRGALDSGAAEKAKITFGQNFASNELSNYMNLLAGQQQVGLSAGNAIMGVSTSATNAIAGQNTNAGNAAANAALAAGNANANLWGTVGNTAGQLGGALFQYGTGQFAKPSPTITPPNYYAPSAVSLSPATPMASAPSPYSAFTNFGF